jgi:hypothetical protein
MSDDKNRFSAVLARMENYARAASRVACEQMDDTTKSLEARRAGGGEC